MVQILSPSYTQGSSTRDQQLLAIMVHSPIIACKVAAKNSCAAHMVQYGQLLHHVLVLTKESTKACCSNITTGQYVDAPTK